MERLPQEPSPRYLTPPDRLIEESSKEENAEVARVLALRVAHYQNKYGAIPVKESLPLMLTETIDADQAKELADGFGVLIIVMQTLATPEGAH